MPNKWMPDGWTEFLCEHLEAGTYRLGGIVEMGTKRAAVLCGICYKANLISALDEVARTADRISRATTMAKPEAITGEPDSSQEIE